MRKLLYLFCLLWPALGWPQAIHAPDVKLKEAFFQNPNPLAPEWDPISETVIQMLPQNITQPSLFKTSIPQLKVQALHNEKWFAVRLTWEDPTKDFRVSTDLASDACAIQFPLKDASQTSPFMGSKEAPVAIIHWKAVWQNDVEDHYQEVKDLYPNTYVETYQFGIQAATQSGNPVSQPGRKIPVEELMAQGFGTLTTQATQGANGSGVWENGKWHVVLVKLLNPKDENDPVLKKGQSTSIAFALWEGEGKDRGARKNYAPWVPFHLE